MTNTESVTLRVLSAGAVEYVVTQLARPFTARTGIAVNFSFNTIAGVKQRLANGEAGDIVIGTTAAIAQLAEAGTVIAGSGVEIGRTLSGICVREGAAVPDISTPEAFKAALLASKAFAYTNPAAGGTSGIYLTGVMQKLGILDAMTKKAVLCINGEDVVGRIVSGEADLGSTFISEFFLAKGVVSAGPFPAPLGNATSYSAAVLGPAHHAGGVPSPRRREAAGQFIAAITDAAQRPAWIAGGFEPVRWHVH